MCCVCVVCVVCVCCVSYVASAVFESLNRVSQVYKLEEKDWKGMHKGWAQVNLFEDTEDHVSTWLSN